MRTTPKTSGNRSIAAGRFGAYYEAGLKPWDVAAASLIVKEAGGVVTTTQGQPLDLLAREEGHCCLEMLAAKNLDIQKQLIPLLTAS